MTNGTDLAEMNFDQSLFEETKLHTHHLVSPLCPLWGSYFDYRAGTIARYSENEGSREEQ